jgi:multiple sugar transport system substrate-binding protein
VPAAHATGRVTAPITLKFQSWDPPDVTNQFIKACERLHPDIRVQTLNVPGDYAVKMETEFAAGKAPDFFYAPDADALKWAQKGAILDVLPYLKAVGINPAKDFLPQSQYWANGKVGGQFLGAAVATEDIYLFYDKNVFAQAGVALPPSDVAHAWTWPQFLAVARQLTVDRHGHHPGQPGFDVRHIVRYGVSLDPTYWPDILPLIYSNGGQIFDKTNRHFVMDQPAASGAVQAVADLALKEHVMPTPTQMTTGAGSITLGSGRLAMQIDGNWAIYFDQYPKKTFPLGIGVLPKFKVYRTVVEGAPLVAWAKTAYPRQAAQMIACVYQNSAPLWRSGIWMPTSNKDLFGPDSEKWANTPIHPANFRSVAIDSLKYAQDTPILHVATFAQVWSNLVTPAIDQVLSGKKSARAAFTSIKAQVDALLAQK